MDPAQASEKTPGTPERLVKPAVRLAEPAKSRDLFSKRYPGTARKQALMKQAIAGGQRRTTRRDHAPKGRVQL